jgi:HlyD family secretion protein
MMATQSSVPALPLSFDGLDADVKTPPTLLRKTLMASASVFGILFALAAVVPMSGAVIGHGQVGVETNVKRISHPLGGVVSQVLVKNGQHVKKGDLLVRLDNEVSSADALYSSLTVEQLLAQKARLEAERTGSGTLVFPAELLQANSASAQQAMADETHLFQLHQQERIQLKAQLQSRIAQAGQNIRAVNAQISSLRKQRNLIEPELKSVRELWERRLVTISRTNQMERAAVDLEGSIAAQQAELSQIGGRISETREQIIQLEASKRSVAGEELARTNAVLNEQRMRKATAVDQNARSEIRAPYSGTVEKLAFSATGEVISSAEPIMEIVPDHDAMVVEASIGVADVDQVRVGQETRIRFSSFSQAVTPEIPGRVIYLAADRSENPQSREPFYVVRVAIDKEAMRSEGIALRSGMPAEVFISTGSRSLLSYITKPLRDQISRAFKGD